MSASTTRTAAGTREREARAIGVEAHVYLFPLVLMEVTRRQTTNVPAGARPGFGPMNAFAHIREFPSSEFRAVVRPNFDTLYSPAWLDLTIEPMVVSVPDTHGRYFLLPLLDMWTDVFAVPGQRTTGTGAGHFAVLPPAWRGDIPDGVEAIQAPTPYVWVIGRTQTNGPSDYEAVHQVQDGLAISSLSQFGLGAIPPEARIDVSVDMERPPLEQVRGMSAQQFFTLAAELLTVHPPHVTDWSALARMRRAGLHPGRGFAYDTLDPSVRNALDDAPAEALALMQATLPRLTKIVNGWGTSTDSIGVYGNFYLKRAIIAMGGLGANPPEDAIYPLNVSDADGQPLDGANNYVLHFDHHQLPPVGAFWSVTMYDADGFQAANPLNRFALGDRDDLTYSADGSLDIYIQHHSPGREHEPNWLPAPTGPLGVTMRLYAPAPEALDGRWNPPPIERRAR